MGVYSSEDDNKYAQYIGTDDKIDIGEDFFTVESDRFAELFRFPVWDDYGLVELKTRSQSKFYLVRITNINDDKEDYEDKFQRCQKFSTFLESPVDDTNRIRCCWEIRLWLRILNDRKV